MIRTHAIAVGFTALTLFAASAQAHPGGTGSMGPAGMSQMMQGNNMQSGHGGMGAGRQGAIAQAESSTTPHQHGAATVGPTAGGGCPMTSAMSQHGTQPAQK